MLKRTSPHPFRSRRARVVVLTAALAAAVPALAAPQAGAAGPVPSAIHLHASTWTKAQIAHLSTVANQHVIVLMRNQFGSTLSQPSAGALEARRTKLVQSQTSVVKQLQSLNTPHLRQFHFINAVSGTISKSEQATLENNPQVLAVVPDRTITLPDATDQASTTTASASAAKTPMNRTPGTCGTARKPLQEPEALRMVGAATAHDGLTGSGVKVAVFPDGLDPTIPDYVRSNGKHVIFDYKDFTGGGPNGVTGGAEAFGDVSSIAAQGRRTYDLSTVTNPAVPLPNGCDIRIKGVAPGASIAVMKVFGAESASESTILEGMEWAVDHDHVNVLSQSFGGSAVPADAHDPIAMFDAEAVRDGITVVASSGDAGVTNTIGSPAADGAGVISVGATTSFRAHAQVSEHGYQLGGKGWESDNIATLSSSGFTSNGPNSVDLVAPGDGGWADCSPKTQTFQECANSFGTAGSAAPVLYFGGTSEACPFVAGVAALVIQAYRSTHHGQTPAPAVVKQILTSSARDLGAPVEEQGAGQVNATAAVKLARAYTGTTAKRPASALRLTTTKLSVTGTPGSAHTAKLTVHNLGTKSVTLHPALKHFGAAKTISTATMNYDPSAAGTKTFTYWLDGQSQPYVEHDFTVPAGYQRLETQLGLPAGDASSPNEGFLVLFDPKGRLAQDSDPQGAGAGFGQGDVRNPMPGRWRAIIFARPTTDGYTGKVTFSASVQKLVKVSGTSLRSLTVKPYGTATVSARYHLPQQPGDSSAGVYFGGGLGVVPVLMRTTVPVSAADPGTVYGTLTGGNGRPALGSQEQDYAFRVPAGVKDVDVDVKVPGAAFDTLASLVDPSGRVVDSQTSYFDDMTSPTGAGASANGEGAHLSWTAPTPGMWTLDILTISGDLSGATSVPFTADIAFNTVQVTSSGIPDSSETTIAAGDQAQASVTVTNTGDSPEIYYLDPRRDSLTTYPMSFTTYPSGQVGTDVAQVIVPPFTTSAIIGASADEPIAFDSSPLLGSPSVASTEGTTAVVGLEDPEASQWSCGPAAVGPFTKPAPATEFGCEGMATTATMNDSISVEGGNLWQMTTDPSTPNAFDPVFGGSTVVQPGQSVTLGMNITPSQTDQGSTVNGFIAVETMNMISLSSDDLVNIPYSYTVTAPSSTD